MFQMRLPKAIAGELKRPLRVGLGVIPKPQARKIADKLAAIAREKFERIEAATRRSFSSRDQRRRRRILIQTRPLPVV